MRFSATYDSLEVDLKTSIVFFRFLALWEMSGWVVLTAIAKKGDLNCLIGSILDGGAKNDYPVLDKGVLRIQFVIRAKERFPE